MGLTDSVVEDILGEKERTRFPNGGRGLNVEIFNRKKKKDYIVLKPRTNCLAYSSPRVLSLDHS